jgi:CheY-like chemotaxis protein
MKILVVEDDPVVSKVIDSVLRKRSFETVMVENGLQALEVLKNTPDIGLVLSDIMMPEIDGLQLFGLMKQNPAWANIPVVFSTSLADLDTVRKAGKMGCRHYVLKPINATHLTEKVRDALNGAGGSQASVEAACQPDDPPGCSKEK